MKLSLRLRCDFTVTDSQRLLAAARAAYREIHPGSNVEEADAMVTGAADALFVVLEQAGLLGDAIESRLADHAGIGLAVGEWRAQMVLHEPRPLAAGPLGDCLRDDDVFALPPSDDD